MDENPEDMKGRLYIEKNLCINQPIGFKPLLFKDKLNFLSAVGSKRLFKKITAI